MDDDGVRRDFEKGQKVIVDKGRITESVVHIVDQSPDKIFTTIKDEKGNTWNIMSNRLTLCEN